MDEELSAQRRADLMRQRAEIARQEAERLDGAAARWQAGADGERLVADALVSLAQGREGAVVLNDRLLNPGQSRVNLDHVVATLAGVFVIDAKNWSGELSVDSSAFGNAPGRESGSRRYSRRADLDKVTKSARPFGSPAGRGAECGRWASAGVRVRVVFSCERRLSSSGSTTWRMSALASQAGHNCRWTLKNRLVASITSCLLGAS